MARRRRSSSNSTRYSDRPLTYLGDDALAAAIVSWCLVVSQRLIAEFECSLSRGELGVCAGPVGSSCLIL
jgi:hypothetical protein